MAAKSVGNERVPPLPDDVDNLRRKAELEKALATFGVPMPPEEATMDALKLRYRLWYYNVLHRSIINGDIVNEVGRGQFHTLPVTTLKQRCRAIGAIDSGNQRELAFRICCHHLGVLHHLPDQMTGHRGREARGYHCIAETLIRLPLVILRAFWTVIWTVIWFCWRNLWLVLGLVITAYIMHQVWDLLKWAAHLWQSLPEWLRSVLGNVFEAGLCMYQEVLQTVKKRVCSHCRCVPIW
jgi:hypothetical protein